MLQFSCGWAAGTSYKRIGASAFAGIKSRRIWGLAGCTTLQSVGIKLDNESLRVAAGLRLGAALVHPRRCVCEALVLADGHHGLACRRSAERHSRHNQINDIVQRALPSASVLATQEPVGLCPNRKRHHNGKEIAACNETPVTPHAKIHFLHLTYKPRAL